MVLKTWHSKKLLSDQGRQFIASKFKHFTERINIKHVLTSAHNPTANSIVERANGSIGNIARISKNCTLNELKSSILKHSNFTANRTTQTSPFEILYGYSPFNITNVPRNDLNTMIRERNKTNISKEELKRNEKKKKIRIQNWHDCI
jgi:transposase InsO family protein